VGVQESIKTKAVARGGGAFPRGTSAPCRLARRIDARDIHISVPRVVLADKDRSRSGRRHPSKPQAPMNVSEAISHRRTLCGVQTTYSVGLGPFSIFSVHASPNIEQRPTRRHASPNTEQRPTRRNIRGCPKPRNGARPMFFKPAAARRDGQGELAHAANEKPTMPLDVQTQSVVIARPARNGARAKYAARPAWVPTRETLVVALMARAPVGGFIRPATPAPDGSAARRDSPQGILRGSARALRVCPGTRARLPGACPTPDSELPPLVHDQCSSR